MLLVVQWHLNSGYVRLFVQGGRNVEAVADF